MRLPVRPIALGLALAMSGSVAGAIGLVSGSAGAATQAPLTIALVCSCTGAAAAEYSPAPGAFRARIDLQNAMGGINGHKISTLVLDDQTSPTQDPTAVQEAVSHGVIGIVAVSALFFEGAKYANQAGVPVTGSSSDGPEWGTPPYTNMFASDTGSVDPKYPVNTAIGNFLVAHGGNVVGSYAYGISPSSTRSAVGAAQAVIHAGGRQGVLDTSIPFGGTDFTSTALVAKSKHINGMYAGLLDNSNFALATAMKQAGVTLKAVLFPTGYEPGAITSPAWPDLQGDYFESTYRPFSLPNAGTAQMKAALQKYDGFTKSQFPSFDQYEAWLGADLMIKGIELAGKDRTSAGVITALRHVQSYNGNGILPVPINYSTVFGHDLPLSCGWFLQARSKGFVPVSSQPTCGRDLPGTTTVASS